MKKITLLLTAVFVLSVASMYAQQYNPDSDFVYFGLKEPAVRKK